LIREFQPTGSSTLIFPVEQFRDVYSIFYNLIGKRERQRLKANMKENNEKKIKNSDEISKLIKAFPKDIPALDKRSVLAKVNSEGSGI
jgi:hypothetical protein